MAKLQKACRSYNDWKAKHSPEHKPWLFPEQNSLPPLNPADIARFLDVTNVLNVFLIFLVMFLAFLICLQCFDAVGWAAGRASGL